MQNVPLLEFPLTKDVDNYRVMQLPSVAITFWVLVGKLLLNGYDV